MSLLALRFTEFALAGAKDRLRVAVAEELGRAAGRDPRHPHARHRARRPFAPELFRPRPVGRPALGRARPLG